MTFWSRSEAVNLHGETLEELKALPVARRTRTAGLHKLLRPLQNRCRAATAVCMLVQLKRYLQTCYGISDSHVAGHSDRSARTLWPTARMDTLR